MKFDVIEPNPHIKQVFDVRAEEVHRKKEEITIVDVRESEEFYGDLGHIPGASFIPLHLLSDKLNQFPKDATLVFVCKSGGRSSRAAALASSLGYDSVYNLQGGMLRWNELKLGIER